MVLDAHGDFAAGTSTGGWEGKMPGRVGDTPGIGHGVYADKKAAAVSCTGNFATHGHVFVFFPYLYFFIGNGEAFMVSGVARLTALNVEKGEVSMSEAIKDALREDLHHATVVAINFFRKI